MSALPSLGYGLGLRVDHYEEILRGQPNIDWLEVLSENYMVPGGKPHFYLRQLRERYPMVMHGVSLSIGSTDPINSEYLRQLKGLADSVEPAWISDHLCWTGVDGINLHDLMPLPYTEEAIAHVADRVSRVQDHLGRRILLENVSSYVSYKHSQIPEWEFVSAIAQQADCLILLDVNNVYVSARNHGYDPKSFIDGVPTSRVQQFHLAGHDDSGPILIDTHDAPVCEAVWDLYAYAVRRFGPVSTMIERDDRIPPLADLLQELDRARGIATPILQAAA